MCKISLNYLEVNWREFFVVDFECPSGLRRIRSMHPNRIGSAGTKSFDLRTNKPHMWRVTFNDKRWAVHRIILILSGFHLENNKVVDHINGDPFDNRLENLRIVDQTLNTRNSNKLSSNTSGHKGVSLCDNGRGNLYWKAFWKENGRTVSENFSVDSLGFDKAKELAVLRRKEAIDNLNSLGYGYTNRHSEG